MNIFQVCVGGGGSLKTNIRFEHLSIFILILHLKFQYQVDSAEITVTGKSTYLRNYREGGAGTKSVEYMRSKYPWVCGCPGQN